jgi:diacylglycerol kinase family enzyme
MPNQPVAFPDRTAPLFIVMNARSGAADADTTLAQMRSQLEAANRVHEFVLIERPDDVARQARRAVQKAREHGGAVVAVGGDGTINAIVHAALPFEVPVGIVPQGTFNYSGRAHGIPLELEAAIDVLLHPRLKPVQVGAVNDRIFLVNVSLGLYPKALERREEATSQFGRKPVVALWSGLRTLLQESGQLELEIELEHEREVVRTPTLFVGNNSLQLERVGLDEADDVQQRRLAAVIVKANRPSALLWLALRGALGTLGDADHIRSFAFRSMTVTPRLRRGRRDIKIAIDGEILRMRPPLDFSIAPYSLRLMVPRQDANGAPEQR